MAKEKAAKDIANLVQKAYAALEKAKTLAIEHELEFEFSPAYSMGGIFYGKFSEDYKKWFYRSEDYGWISSTQECH